MNEDFKFGLEVDVDLDEVEKVLTSDGYAQFLLNNTVDFATAAFILQAGMDALEAAREEIVEE